MAKTKRQREKIRKDPIKGHPVNTTLSAVMRSDRFRFAVAFTLSCVALYTIINALPPSFTSPINEHVAATLGLFLNSFGIPASIDGDTVSEGGLAFRIIPECTPLFTSGLFLSFVVFHPSTVRQKAIVLAMGCPVLYLGNLVRLAVVFMVSRYDRGLFEVTHVYLGQVFTIFLVVLTCILWLKWLDREASEKGMPGGAGFIPVLTGFLVRLALISGCLFLVWMKVHHGYVWFVDRFMVLGFSLFNHHLDPTRPTAVYYETFNIVTFTALVLATASVTWHRKIRGLAAGLGLLFLIHLFHRIDNALIVLFNFTGAMAADLTLLVIGQYLLPVLLWLAVVVRKFPRE